MVGAVLNPKLPNPFSTCEAEVFIEKVSGRSFFDKVWRMWFGFACVKLLGDSSFLGLFVRQAIGGF